MTDLADLVVEMRRLSRLIDGGIEMMRDQAQRAAQAERDYRKAVAVGWLEAPEGTVGAREAWVRGETADLRYARDLAEGMKRAADVAVRARTTQVSAWQTAVNAEQAAMKFAQLVPEDTP